MTRIKQQTSYLFRKFEFPIIGALCYLITGILLVNAVEQNPDNFLVGLVGAFPFGFTLYLIYPVLFGEFSLLIRYSIVIVIGLIVGLLIQIVWNRSKLAANFVIGILLLNSCGFTVYVMMRFLRD